MTSWLALAGVQVGGSGSRRDPSQSASPPQLRVEVGERLVHQQHLGFDHERSGESDPLLLSARQLARVPRFQAFELHEPQGMVDLGGEGRSCEPAQAQPVRHVVEDGHVGEQGVLLEHRGRLAQVGWQAAPPEEQDERESAHKGRRDQREDRGQLEEVPQGHVGTRGGIGEQKAERHRRGRGQCGDQERVSAQPKPAGVGDEAPPFRQPRLGQNAQHRKDHEDRQERDRKNDREQPERVAHKPAYQGSPAPCVRCGSRGHLLSSALLLEQIAKLLEKPLAVLRGPVQLVVHQVQLLDRRRPHGQAHVAPERALEIQVHCPSSRPPGGSR